MLCVEMMDVEPLIVQRRGEGLRHCCFEDGLTRCEMCCASEGEMLGLRSFDVEQKQGGG